MGRRMFLSLNTIVWQAFQDYQYCRASSTRPDGTFIRVEITIMFIQTHQNFGGHDTTTSGYGHLNSYLIIPCTKTVDSTDPVPFKMQVRPLFLPNLIAAYTAKDLIDI